MLTSTTTDPRGYSFLSYRRSRRKEVSALIRAQRERGIPTWQDVDNLEEEHTTTELRRVLEDPMTANAVLWITPDVADSSVIREVEAPRIMERAERADPFFVVPVAAGGAGYSSASSAIGDQVSLSRLDEWNIRKIENDPARLTDAHDTSRRVLARRLRAIDAYLDRSEALRLAVFVRTAPPENSGLSLAMDWTSRFEIRHASETSWNRHLLPAAGDVVSAIEKHCSGRKVVASGRPTIGAAFVLGRAFLSPRGINVAWSQFTVGAGEAEWDLSIPADEVQISTKCRDGDTSASELAVLISVNASVEHAWKASRSSLPAFRGILQVEYLVEARAPMSPGQAIGFAKQTMAAIKEARNRMRPKGATHVFLAAPAGVAFLLGQLSNTLGPIRIYEHDESGSVGHYVAGPLVEIP